MSEPTGIHMSAEVTFDVYGNTYIELEARARGHLDALGIDWLDGGWSINYRIRPQCEVISLGVTPSFVTWVATVEAFR